METNAEIRLTSGGSHVTDDAIEGESTPETDFDDASNDVGDEPYYVYHDSAESCSQPLNLSATPTVCVDVGGYESREAEQRSAMGMDTQMRRSLDVRSLRELGNMSEYLLHIPTSSMMGAHHSNRMDGGHINGYDSANINQPDGDVRDGSKQGHNRGNAENDDANGVGENVEGVIVDGHYGGLDLSAMSNETEVMRAARALFSKRTRTLYHWIYPDTPKIQLKAVVSKAWDSMLTAEKQFYVSQVLGKFGCLQSQLMINPQLGSFTTPTSTQEQRAHVQQVHEAHRLYMAEAGRASAAMTPPSHYAHHMHDQFYNGAIGPGPIRRRRGRPKGAATPSALHHRYGDLRSIYVQRLQAVKRLADGDIPLQIMRHCDLDVRGQCSSVAVSGNITGHGQNTRVSTVSMAENEFPNDPELRHEFEKFEWTLHMVD